MKFSAHRLIILFVLLLVAIGVAAQGETEDEENVIPYFQSSTGFDVPILGEGWENLSDERNANFVNDDLNAGIYVTSIDTLDVEEAILTALGQLFPNDFPAPRYSGRVGLLNGTWRQEVRTIDDTSISSFALLRSDQTYVVTLFETDPNYDIAALIVRTPVDNAGTEDAPAPDVLDGIAAGLVLLDGVGVDELVEPESVTTITEPSTWTQVTYPTNATPLNVYGYQFRNYTYLGSVRGDMESIAALDAWKTTMLGFFLTPSNKEYLYLGLAASFGIFAVLILSIVWRYRNARKDYELVQQLSEEE